jgi:gliding motility-associated-like protein
MSDSECTISVTNSKVREMQTTNYKYMPFKFHSSLRRILTGFLTIVFISLGLFEANATHIVGGELTYRCLGDGRFELQLTVYRDCENAQDGAVFDDPASIGVFRKSISGIYNRFTSPINTESGGSASGQIVMPFMGADTIREAIPATCLDDRQPGDLCIERAVYRVVITNIPAHRGDLFLVYQRCCRNIILDNIQDPEGTGMSLMVRFTQEARLDCNSAPDLPDFPPLYHCRGIPFEIPQGGPDIDGDSVVYRLCAPFEGAEPGSGLSMPQPPNIPPYDSVQWVDPPYSTSDMLGNPDDPLTIDPETGLLTGTPMTNGQFLVSICIDEYRDGRLINSIPRQFEMNVRSCEQGPIADFEMPDILCDEDRTVTFFNTSVDANNYQWFVDEGDGPVFFTDEGDPPPFVFQDTGKFYVTLIAAHDSICFDTLTKPINVQINGLIPDFDVVLDECVDSLVLAPIDQSIDTIGHIVEWTWTVDIGDSILVSTDTFPRWVFKDPLTVTITLDILSSNGCTESITKENINLNIIEFEFFGDTIEVCPFEPTEIVAQSDPNLTYTWVPETDLDLTNPHAPLVSTDSNRLYRVTVTDGICTLEDSVMIIVKPVSEIILTDLADSCDLERVVIAEGIIVGSGLWYSDDDYSNLIGEGDTLRIDVPISQTVYFTGIDTISECLLRDSIDLRSFIVNLDYQAKYDFCEGEVGIIDLTNIDPLDTVTIVWEPNDIIISDLNQLRIEVFSETAVETVLYFHAVNQFGCELMDSIEVEFHPYEEVDFEFDYVCGDSTVHFLKTTPGIFPVFWDFGDDSTSTERNPSHTYKEEGIYTVTLMSEGFCPDTASETITINFFDISIQDTVIACFGQPVTLNPGGDTDLDYEWSPPELFDDPNAATQVVQVDESTRVTVVIFDPEADTSCIRFDTIDIVVPPEFEIETNVDTLLACDEEEFTLSVEVTPSDIPVSIVWTDDQGNVIGTTTEIVVTPGESDFYTVTVTDEWGCSLSETIPVIFEPFDFGFEVAGGISVICAFDTLLVVITGLDPDEEYIIEWMDDPSIISGHRDDTLIIYIEENTTYVVAVTNEAGCTEVRSVTVNVRDLNLIINATADPNEIFKGEESFLDVEGFDPDWTVMWTDTSSEQTLSDLDIVNPIATPEKTTTYYVMVEDEYGCIGEDSVTVEVEVLPCEPPYVFLPNAFSPNGDGDNDVLYVRGIHIIEVELIIYNRYGQKVFESFSQDNGWDGTFDDEELAPNTYGYHLYVMCNCGGEYVETGNVTIVK